MPEFKIYAGLNGGFGGAEYIETLEFDTESEATDYAYDLAVQEYEGYIGNYGLRSIEDIMEEDEASEDEAQEIYEEEMDSWLDFFVELVDDESDFE